jgi:ATP-binding cassette subfamily B protein
MAFADTLGYIVACLYSKYMIEAVLSTNPFLGILLVVSIRIAVHFIWNILSTILEDIIGSIQQTKIKKHFVTQIYKKMSDIDLAQFENTDFYAKLSRAIEQAEERPLWLLGTIRNLFSTFFTILGLFATLFILSPFSLLIAFLGGLITFLIYFINSKLEYNYYVDKVECTRIFDYIKRIFYMPQYKNDIHYFNITPVFLKKYHENTQKQCAVIKKHCPKIIFLKSITTFLSVGINIGFACFFVVWQILIGELRIGDFSAALAAITALGNCLFNFGMIFPQFKEHSYSINDYLDILNYDSELYSSKGIDVSKSELDKIKFKNVSFGYNKNNLVIKNLTLNIKKGEKIALVGANGAGKTTFLKLLLKLYSPDKGVIYFNKLPYNEINTKSFYSLLSPMFQNTNSYAFSIKENVDLVKENSVQDDKSEINNCLIKSGLGTKIDSFSDKENTMLISEINHNAIEFSGGENQKLGIARVMYRNTDIIVMDEPTAALDPLSEEALYKTIEEMSKNKTVIIVSHRLSCVKGMDRILYFENGKVSEEGSHKELMEMKGKYAKMYKLQASRYGE